MLSTSRKPMQQAFEPGCPYYRDSHDKPLLMYRLYERFAEWVIIHYSFSICSSGTDNIHSGSEYAGDSLGNRAYIDRSQHRPCSKKCRCWHLDDRLDHDFVFIVRKTTKTINVAVKSATLYMYLELFFRSHLRRSTSQSIDGFLLLKHTEFLQTHLDDLRKQIPIDIPQGPLISAISEQNTQIEARFALLVEGLVTDHEVFQSFGYEDLFEQGYLSYKCWKSFQS